MITDADRAKAREITAGRVSALPDASQQELNDAITAALDAAASAARDKALERAAKKCDAKRHLASGDFKIIPSELAQEIRALKGEA